SGASTRRSCVSYSTMSCKRDRSLLRNRAMSSSHFDVHPLAGRIGAEIAGLDLSRPIADGVIAEVRKALVRHKVIFFRDQKLDADAHVVFARRFRPLTTAHPTVPSLQGNAHILDL